jgi:hypothetical protein
MITKPQAGRVDKMLSKDGVQARYILAFCCFFLSGTEMLTGSAATISGIMGTVELATALLHYSPLYELYDIIKTYSQS